MRHNRWIGAMFVGLGVLSAGERASAQVLFYDDFESGASAWTLTGLWHVESSTTPCGQLLDPFPSGARCLRMGDLSGTACDFVGSEAAPTHDRASLAVPVALVGTGGRAWLRYVNRIDTESCNMGQGIWWDLSELEISVDGGASWDLLGMDCYGEAWHKGRANLTPYIGSNVLVRFSFFAGDGKLNDEFGWLIDDVSIRMEPGAPFCDSSSACPCGNFTVGGDNIGGCKASNGRQAELYALGQASMTQETVVLHADSMPLGTTAFVFQGSAATSPMAQFDGTFCLGGQLIRLGTRMTTTGAISIPSPGGLPLSTVASANTTLYYQVHYRNAANYCTEGTKNLTNAYSIHWTP